ASERSVRGTSRSLLPSKKPPTAHRDQRQPGDAPADQRDVGVLFTAKSNGPSARAGLLAREHDARLQRRDRGGFRPPFPACSDPGSYAIVGSASLNGYVQAVYGSGCRLSKSGAVRRAGVSALGRGPAARARRRGADLTASERARPAIKPPP